MSSLNKVMLIGNVGTDLKLDGDDKLKAGEINE